ncbi:hypothetical protein HN954_00545 [bacterium]|nr:hypothetical protein [bacterium]MBT6995903.1 hypothetical protein [bacterium]
MGVLNRIQNLCSNTESSLSVVELYKNSLQQAQDAAMAESGRAQQERQKALDNRRWWEKAGKKILKYGTLGLHTLVTREKRQKWFNTAFEKSLQRKFDTLNKNVEKLEKEATSRKKAMLARAKRTLIATHNPSVKATLKTELITAVTHTGSLSGVNLSSWGITDDQEKIDFLEAATELDFVKADLAAIGISKAKHLQQKEMIDSAQKQQEVLTDVNQFKFEEIKIKAGFAALKNHVDGVTVPNISDLVTKLESELQASGINVETDIYAALIKKEGLLVDSTKLVLLVKKIPTVDANKVLHMDTRLSLLAWIKSAEDENGGALDKKRYTAETEVATQKTNLDNLFAASDTLLKKLKTRTVASTEFKNDQKEAQDLSSEFFVQKQAFENFKQKLEDKKKELPEKDKKALEDSWNRLEAVREFILKRARHNLEKFDKHTLNEKNRTFLTTKEAAVKGKRDAAESALGTINTDITTAAGELATRKSELETIRSEVKSKESDSRKKEKKFQVTKQELREATSNLRRAEDRSRGTDKTIADGKVTTATTDLATAKKAYDDADSNIPNAVRLAKKDWENAKRDLENAETIARFASLADQAKTDFNTAKTDYGNAETEFNDAETALNNKQEDALTKKEEVTKLENTLEQKKSERSENKLSELQREFDQAEEKRKEFELENNISLKELEEEQTKIEGELSLLKSKSVEWTKNDSGLGLAKINERIQQKLRTENFADEIDKKFVEQLERNDQYEQLKKVSEGTSVEVDYKIVSGMNSLKFPNQLNTPTHGNFVVYRKTENSVMLEEKGGGGNKMLTILGPAAAGGVAYKNAIVSNQDLGGGAYNATDPAVGGAGDHAIALNMKIA